MRSSAKNRQLMGLVLLVVIIIVIVAVASRPEEKSPGGDQREVQAGESVSPTVVVSPTVKASPSKTASTVTGGTLTYDQALQIYGSNRMQFDDRCQAKPSNMVVKQGTKVMFDNRSGDKRAFNIGGKNYTIDGYGFLVLTMTGPNNALPATVAVNCGSAQNVATILIDR